MTGGCWWRQGEIGPTAACAPDAESSVQGSGGTSTELMGSKCRPVPPALRPVARLLSTSEPQASIILGRLRPSSRSTGRLAQLRSVHGLTFNMLPPSAQIAVGSTSVAGKVLGSEAFLTFRPPPAVTFTVSGNGFTVTCADRLKMSFTIFNKHPVSTSYSVIISLASLLGRFLAVLLGRGPPPTWKCIPIPVFRAAYRVCPVHITCGIAVVPPPGAWQWSP